MRGQRAIRPTELQHGHIQQRRAQVASAALQGIQPSGQLPRQVDGRGWLQPMPAHQQGVLVLLDESHDGRAHPLQHVLQAPPGLLALHGQRRVHQVLVAGAMVEVTHRIR